jgi:hypothetical protein
LIGYILEATWLSYMYNENIKTLHSNGGLWNWWGLCLLKVLHTNKAYMYRHRKIDLTSFM